jgi:hypothetical protein
MYLAIFRSTKTFRLQCLKKSCEIAARRDDYLFSVLGKLSVVPIGDTGIILFSMRQHAEDFVGAAFDNRKGSGHGSRW